MPDYTPEGVKRIQRDIAVGQLNLIDKKLKKTNFYLGVLTAIGLTSLLFKTKAFKEFIAMKGE